MPWMAILKKPTAQYGSIGRCTLDGRWPDVAVTCLVGVSDRFENAIIEKPCVTESDYRGKVRYLLERLSNPDRHPDLSDFASQLLAYRASPPVGSDITKLIAFHDRMSVVEAAINAADAFPEITDTKHDLTLIDLTTLAVDTAKEAILAAPTTTDADAEARRAFVRKWGPKRQII